MSVGPRISHDERDLLLFCWASAPWPESWRQESWRQQPRRQQLWDTGSHLGVLQQVPFQWDAQGSHLTEVDHPAPVLADVVDQHHPAPAARQGQGTAPAAPAPAAAGELGWHWGQAVQCDEGHCGRSPAPARPRGGWRSRECCCPSLGHAPEQPRQGRCGTQAALC